MNKEIMIINTCGDIGKAYELLGLCIKIKVFDKSESLDEIYISEKLLKKIRDKRRNFRPDITYINSDGNIYKVWSDENSIEIRDIIPKRFVLKDE